MTATGPEGVVIGHLSDVPVGDTDVEILWATRGEDIRRLPSARVRVQISSDTPGAPVLAEYELDHTALPVL
jgi:hypothetical protein